MQISACPFRGWALFFLFFTTSFLKEKKGFSMDDGNGL
jgi:hypothetical protein